MKNFTSGLLMLLFSQFSAQIRIDCIVSDASNGEKIEFANAGIPGKVLGTVTDAAGHFSLLVPDSFAGLNLKISMVGYGSQSIPVSRLAQMKSIRLEPELRDLKEITVSAPKTRIRMMGNETTGSFLTAGFMKNNLGAEMAVKIRVKHPNTELRRFLVNVTSNKLDSVPLFRLNIYEVDSAGRPGRNLLHGNLLVSPPGKTGLVEVDLRPLHIVTSKDVFVSIEWIRDLGDVKGLYFSARLGGENTWYRLASQDDWHHTSAVGIGLHAEIAY